MRLSALQAALAEHGQRLSLDPPGDPTVGALLAENVSGPLRHRFGAPRDLVLGVTLVLADGTIASAGGKVVKNVAGYDLARLVCGSRGTAGADRARELPAAPAAARGAHARGRDGRRGRGRARAPPLPAPAERARRAPSRRRARALRGLGARGRGAARDRAGARRRRRGGRGRVGDVAPPPGGGARPRSASIPAAWRRRWPSSTRRSSAPPRASPTRQVTQCHKATTARRALVERIRPSSTRTECSPRDPRAHARLRALRVLPPDLPDVRPLARGDGLAARAHPAHGRAPRRDGDAQRDRQGALRPLPRLHGVRVARAPPACATTG